VSSVEPGLRAEAEQHIREHVEGERAHVERVSRIRELVLGAQDGLLVPRGVVTGMAAANPGRTAILVAGFAEAVAGSIAMAAGSFTPQGPKRRSTGPRSRMSAQARPAASIQKGARCRRHDHRNRRQACGQCR
jgi:VIT1/CCC1 family predicted Fe2+/Mn2+ transporter